MPADRMVNRRGAIFNRTLFRRNVLMDQQTLYSLRKRADVARLPLSTCVTMVRRPENGSDA
jgi:hypothetical protein